MRLFFPVESAALGAITGDQPAAYILRWRVASLGILLILSLDITGSIWNHHTRRGFTNNPRSCVN